MTMYLKMVTACFMDNNNKTTGVMIFEVSRENKEISAMIVRHAHEGGEYKKAYLAFDNRWEEILIPEDWDSNAVDYVSRRLCDMVHDGELGVLLACTD